MANNSINLINLDHSSLKQSFIEYVSSQEKFRDYDFTGSNINVLLDILSYNTYHNAFFLNMVASESHLDSAQLESSVLSHAKSLNYLPRSVRSALAKVKVTFTATGENGPYIIQKGESFSTLIKNNSYIFSIPETIIVASEDTNFSFEVDVYEGAYLKDAYIFTNSTDIQRFRISNRNVDIGSITVTVFEDNSIIGTTYLFSDTLLDLNETSKSYFLQPAETGFYEVIFGDGVIGQKPKIGSTIVIDYRVASGSIANGAKVFSINFDPTGASDELLSSPEVETLLVSENGEEKESIESIKFYAPRHFQIQQRGIVPSDYEILLRQNFPEINAISVYGGEELNPPVSAKIFISLDISDVNGIPDSKKEEYNKFLKRKIATTLSVVFVEPEFTYLSVNSKVNYNLNLTTNSAERIRTLVTNKITEYNLVNLADFNVVFRYSNFITEIDNSDLSIVSNETSIKIYKKANPKTKQFTSIELDFGLPLLNPYSQTGSVNNKNISRTISSTNFIYNGETCFFEDDGAGKIRISKITNFQNVKILDIGFVNYETGKLSIENLFLDGYEGNHIKIFAEPLTQDITVAKSNIVLIEPDAINITVESVRQ